MIQLAARLWTHYSHINWALADQTMVSGVNFLTGIAVARWLGPESFGVFVLLMALFFLINTFHVAFIISPLLSLAPKVEPSDKPAYLGSVFGMQLVLSAVSGLTLIGALLVLAYTKPELALEEYMLPVLAALIGFQLQDFARRYYFASERASAALFNDTISYLGQLAVVMVLFLNQQLTVATVYYAMAGSSACAVLAWTPELRRFVFTRAGLMAGWWRHWHFSKWLALSMGAKWISGNVFILVSAAYLSIGDVGAIGAAQKIMGPAFILFMALENYMPVRASRIYHEFGWAALVAFGHRIGLVGGVATGALSLIAIIWAEPLIVLFYGESYRPYSHLIYWCAAAAFVMFFSRPIMSMLRAAEIMRPFALINGAVAVFSVGVSFPLVIYWGLAGAMTVMLANEFFVTFWFAITLVTWHRRLSIGSARSGSRS